VTSDSTGSTTSDARLEQFRSRAPRQKIHPTEQALLWAVSLQLSFLPWAIGGTRLWAQWVSFGLAVVAFGLMLLPREYQDVAPGQAPFRLFTWPKLIRFPIFWLGLAFLGYITCQTLNPAWHFESLPSGVWWMQKNASYITWLPSGVDVPFERWSPWRLMLIYSSILMTSCAVWVGFTRRRSLQTLFTVLAANAFLLAILGIAQRATNADKIYWFWKSPASYFVSSFIYKNHAGAYFNLVLALCAGVALWHYERSLRRLDKSSPSGVFAFFATAIALVVVFSYSRTATILMFVFLVMAAVIFFWRLKRQPGAETRGPLVIVMVVLALGSFIYLGLRSLRTEQFLASIAKLQQQVSEAGLGTRENLATATWEMFQDQPLYGWGGGSYRYLFRLYQVKHPELVVANGQKQYWEHAHNDYVEVLAELGVVGMSLLLAMLTFMAYRYLRARAWQNPVSLFGALGCGLVVVHSTVDFHFYNPAILTAFCIILVAIIRWAEIEEVNF
jgi:O-antigen ligase